MNTQDLRTFVEVADAGGVTAAARRLGIGKAIVSRQLMRLEADLGIQLLARTTRGASLTEAGATFREYAAKVIADLDTARETIVPNGELRGRLRIAAPLSFGPTHLAPVLADLGRLHPSLHIQTCYSDRHVNLIEEGFDCAIRFGRPAPSTLLARRIAPLYASLVASPDYIARRGSPETLEDLLSHEALLQGTEPWDFVDGNETVTLNVQGRFKADNGVAIRAAALAGLGIACLPDGLVVEHLASGALVRVMSHYPQPVYGIFVIRPPGQHPLRKVRALTELLIERLGAPDSLSNYPSG
ncbi:DNA-binding transcriptional LysR family regulator [Novosphingobium chloroacetimidivorans]|uniref:DNA-binding transcriptional LysR family regulator n=1 Tax=Novosphingobium chloroacetimidivorans TaxID=1428314 RepID=A0A7W7NVR6_9SPHN|nr:LysR family transcriptional regulator [Novosphingobium chloroacetimidivorans]MBB4858788.1 DNA-binding transcriptional LysR family regulator [Novosphingobium chloroacetimidivorans]